MKRRELIRHLERFGCVLVREAAAALSFSILHELRERECGILIYLNQVPEMHAERELE